MEEKKTIVVSDDYLRAEELHKRVKSTVHSVKNSFVELGKMLKEMRDGKLYKELGYQNFEDYCKTEVEINRSYAYELIGISEKLPEDFVRSADKIGVKKLSLLAMLKPEQRAEVIQKVDVESVTVKELKSEISTLKQNNQQLKDKQKQAESRIEELKSENSGLKERRDELQVQIQELENRPVEVMQSTAELEEIERLKQENSRLEIENEALEEQRGELEGKIFAMENDRQKEGEPRRIDDDKRFAEFASNMNQQLVEERKRVKEEAQEEISRANLQRDNAFAEVTRLREQLALAKKTDTPEEPPEMKQFRSQLGAVGICLKQLLDFLCENPDTAFLNQSETALKGALNSLGEIGKQVQT